MPKLKVNGAYDHNSNSSMVKAATVQDGIVGVASGAANQLVAKDVNWGELGLDPAVHGAEVTKLAEQLVNEFDKVETSSYGVKDTYERNTANTNKILDSIAASTVGDAEQKILSVVSLTKEFSRDVSKRPGFFQRLIGKGGDLVRDHRERYDTVTERIDSILADLDQVNSNLNDSTNAIHELDEMNKKDYHTTSLYIAAGQLALNQMIGEVNAIDESGKLVNRSFEFISKLNGLEKRLHDLKITQISRMQNAPQFSIMLSNNQAISEKLKSVKSTLIPAWRTGITTALSIQNAQKSTSLINSIQDATNEYLLENSRMVKQTTIEVAKVSQRSILDVGVLKEIQMNLEEAVQEVLTIQREGAIQRESEMKEIRKLQNNIQAIATVEITNTVKRITDENLQEHSLNIEQRVENA